MKIIKIETCSDCPVVVKASGGTKPVCGHSKLAVTRPYSENRKVELDKAPPEFCPLEDVK